MFKRPVTMISILLIAACALNAQPGRPGSPPPPRGDWLNAVDVNNDGKVDGAEFQAAITRTFDEFDRNGDGVLQPVEFPRGPEPRPGGAPPAGGREGRPLRGERGGPHRDGIDKKLLPPFFFTEAASESVPVDRTVFERTAKATFAEMDSDRDGVLTMAESRPPRHLDGPPPPPNAKFIAAELRFGDKLVKGQPFSAETVIEDTRRLFDGTTVTKKSAGAIYRDTAGRTRREQPLEMVGGFSVVGTDNKPQVLVFINDFAAGTQYFLDANAKIARPKPLGGSPPEPPEPRDAKTESLGTKKIEGLSCEGSRVTFEIPAGHIGNEKPITVVTENWFSPEIQMLVFSRHVDPLAGEHVFKLVNIRRAEPPAELFNVPADYRIAGAGRRE